MGSQQLAKTVSAAATKRFAKWRAALFELQNRARSEISSLDYSTARLSFYSPTSELLPLGAEAEAAESRALARARGLLPQLTGGPAESHALAPAEMQRLSNSAPFASGATEATDMWLAEQIASTLTGEGEEGSSDLLRLTESVNRAARGEILIRPNSKTPAQFEKTKFLTGIRTRAQFQELITKSYQHQPSKNLSPKYLKSRTSYVRQWENMMREGFGANPWRICWGLDLSQPQIRREENYLLAWFTLCRIRMASFGAAEQAVSHVVQFHLTHLDLSPPAFPRLYNRIRIVRHGAKKDEIRKRRPYIKPEHVHAICELCWRCTQDPNRSLEDKLTITAFWMIVAAGFGLLFRVGELARGSEFSAARHWTVNDMRMLERLMPGQNACIRQPQRKICGEHQQEAMPITFWDSPDSFAFAAKIKLQLHRQARSVTLGGGTDAFCIDTAGTSPDPSWVGGRLRSVMKSLFPGAAQGMDFTDHTLRRGGATCLSVMNMDPAIQEHAGGWSRNSASRPAYIARVREVLSAAQPRMFEQRYTIMQDDVGFSINSKPPPAMIPSVGQRTSASEQMLSAESRPMDVDDELEDEVISAVTAMDGLLNPGTDGRQSKITKHFGPEAAAACAPPPAPTPQRKELEDRQSLSSALDDFQDTASLPPAKRQAVRQTPQPEQEEATAMMVSGPRREVAMAQTPEDADPFNLFDKSPSHALDTSFDDTPLEQLCTVFQLGGYHPWGGCKICSTWSPICSFCRRGGHGCARCPHGGRTRIQQFQANKLTLEAQCDQ